MLVPKKIGQTRKIISVIIIVIALSLTLYLLYTNFFAGSVAPAPEPLGSETESITEFSAPLIVSVFTTDFLAKPPFVNLKAFGQLPVKSQTLGRSNPFAVINYGASQAAQ